MRSTDRHERGNRSRPQLSLDVRATRKRKRQRGEVERNAARV